MEIPSLMEYVKRMSRGSICLSIGEVLSRIHIFFFDDFLANSSKIVNLLDGSRSRLILLIENNRLPTAAIITYTTRLTFRATT